MYACKRVSKSAFYKKGSTGICLPPQCSKNVKTTFYLKLKLKLYYSIQFQLLRMKDENFTGKQAKCHPICSNSLASKHPYLLFYIALQLNLFYRAHVQVKWLKLQQAETGVLYLKKEPFTFSCTYFSLLR